MEYKKLGRFNIERQLAKGGMGEVVKSVDDSGRAIALKTILAEHEGNEAFRDLFMREAEITFQLHHPNIVRAYRFERVGNKLVLALEFLDGVNLKDVLRSLYQRKLSMPLPIAVGVMRRVLAGLDYAHKATDMKGHHMGIVHRDLNPSNIFLNYSGEVKILDFGISKATHKDVHQLTPQGELRGKMCYLSPEQMEGGDLDHRTDIFSIGIVFWEMLTGQPLFLRETDSQVMEAIGRGEYRSVQKYRPEMPPEVDELIRKALSLNPAKRFKDALAFIKEMEAKLGRFCMPSNVDEEIGIFARALFNNRASESDPYFLSGYAWLMTQIPGREKEGLALLRKVSAEHMQRPSVLMNRARGEIWAGDRSEGLRLMRRLARADDMEAEAQKILEWLGVRRRPVISFIKRSHPANHVLGWARHIVLGPTAYQAEFLAA